MLLWTILAIVLTLAGVQVRHAFWLLLMWCGLYCWASWRRGETLVAALAVAGTAMLVSLLSIRLGWIQLSFDSVEQIAVGRALAQTGLGNDLGTLLASWGVLLPLVQGASVFLGVDMLTALQPLLWLAFCAILAAFAWQMGGPHPAVTILLPLSLIATSYFFVFQSAYVHNSLASATFLLLFIAATMLALEQQKNHWITLAFLSLFGFTLARTEAPLFAALAIVLVASLFDRGPHWLHFRRLTVIYVASATAWCIALIMMIGTGSDIMTPGRIVVLISALLGAALVVSWPASLFGTGIRAWLPLIVVVASLLAVAGGYLWKPEHTMQNLRAVGGNLLLTGRWGATWWIMAFAFPLLIALSPGRHGRMFAAFFVAFSSVVILMGLARIPYRTGWGDSANRLFTHLLPVLAVWMVHVLSFRTQTGRRPVASAVSLSPSHAFVIGCCFSVPLVLALGLAYWQPAVGSSSLAVRAAEGFCPPDVHGHYNFEVALVPDQSDSYAAACTSGPRSVKLEIIDGQRFRWIELQEYAAGEAWTDFGIRISADGVQWTSVFEYGPTQASAASARTGPTSWRIPAPAETAVRFIAIDFRASLGQNRLLLRRMALVK